MGNQMTDKDTIEFDYNNPPDNLYLTRFNILITNGMVSPNIKYTRATPQAPQVDVEGLKADYKQKVYEGNQELRADTVVWMQHTVETVINSLQREGHLTPQTTPKQDEFGKAYDEGRLKFRNDLTGEMETLKQDEWRGDMENCPNNVDVLIAYDDDRVGFYEADDNDITWQAYDGKEWPISKPKYFILPTPPKTGE